MKGKTKLIIVTVVIALLVVVGACWGLSLGMNKVQTREEETVSVVKEETSGAISVPVEETTTQEQSEANPVQETAMAEKMEGEEILVDGVTLFKSVAEDSQLRPEYITAEEAAEIGIKELKEKLSWEGGVPLKIQFKELFSAEQGKTIPYFIAYGGGRNTEFLVHAVTGECVAASAYQDYTEEERNEKWIDDDKLTEVVDDNTWKTIANQFIEKWDFRKGDVAIPGKVEYRPGRCYLQYTMGEREVTFGIDIRSEKVVMYSFRSE